MVRTIEQILGIHPMNQMDSAATPTFGAFTRTPDYTPFNAVPNQTSLTLGLQEPQPSCGYDTGPLQLAGAQPSTGPGPAEVRGSPAIGRGAGLGEAGCGAVAAVAVAPAPDRADRGCRLRQP